MDNLLAYLIPGILLLVLGGGLIFSKAGFAARLLWFYRSPKAAVVCFGLPALWFLWHIAHLSEADFGKYSNLLLILFAAVGALSFFHVPDFLPVRGLTMLILLSARVGLDAIYMEYPNGYLYLVSFIYLAILVALYFAAVPYRLRDLTEWLYTQAARRKLLGTIMALYGLLLTTLSFSAQVP